MASVQTCKHANLHAEQIVYPLNSHGCRPKFLAKCITVVGKRRVGRARQPWQQQLPPSSGHLRLCAGSVEIIKTLFLCLANCRNNFLCSGPMHIINTLCSCVNNYRNMFISFVIMSVPAAPEASFTELPAFTQMYTIVPIAHDVVVLPTPPFPPTKSHFKSFW